MRSTKLAVSLGLGLLALLAVVVLATRRPRPARAVRVVRDAGLALDAGRPPEADDAGARPAPDVPPIDPAQLALDNQRRDRVAVEIYRDLLQHGRRVAAVRATDTRAGFRDNLRVQGAICNDRVDRDLAHSDALRDAGYTLVTCVNPTTHDTFVTAIPTEDPPPLGGAAPAAPPARRP